MLRNNLFFLILFCLIPHTMLPVADEQNTCHGCNKTVNKQVEKGALFFGREYRPSITLPCGDTVCRSCCRQVGYWRQENTGKYSEQVSCYACYVENNCPERRDQSSCYWIAHDEIPTGPTYQPALLERYFGYNPLGWFVSVMPLCELFAYINYVYLLQRYPVSCINPVLLVGLIASFYFETKTMPMRVGDYPANYHPLLSQYWYAKSLRRRSCLQKYFGLCRFAVLIGLMARLCINEYKRDLYT